MRISSGEYVSCVGWLSMFMKESRRTWEAEACLYASANALPTTRAPVNTICVMIRCACRVVSLTADCLLEFGMEYLDTICAHEGMRGGRGDGHQTRRLAIDMSFLTIVACAHHRDLRPPTAWRIITCATFLQTPPLLHHRLFSPPTRSYPTVTVTSAIRTFPAAVTMRRESDKCSRCCCRCLLSRPCEPQAESVPA